MPSLAISSLVVESMSNPARVVLASLIKPIVYLISLSQSVIAEDVPFQMLFSILFLIVELSSAGSSFRLIYSIRSELAVSSSSLSRSALNTSLSDAFVTILDRLALTTVFSAPPMVNILSSSPSMSSAESGSPSAIISLTVL